MKKCFNIFKRHCPHCKKTVSWELRRDLYDKPRIKCTSCRTHLAINSRDKAINTALFTAFCLVFINTFELDPFSFSAFFVMLAFTELCKVFNILFSFSKVSYSSKNQILG